MCLMRIMGIEDVSEWVNEWFERGSEGVSEWVTKWLGEGVSVWVCKGIVCVSRSVKWVCFQCTNLLPWDIHTLTKPYSLYKLSLYINIYQLTWGRLILILMWGSLNNRYHCRVWQRLGISKRNKSNLERGQCTA